MVETERLTLKLFRVLAILVGSSSLLLFVAFLFAGTPGFVRMDLNRWAVLVWDGLLSIAFFVQHSGMIRRGFRSWFDGIFSPLYYTIVFTISSGIVLIGTLVAWQPSTIVLYELHGDSRLLFRAVFFVAVAGSLWSARTLRLSQSFDPFGLAASSTFSPEKQPRPPGLVVRGPYSYVRHPTYLMVILLIWSCPDVTADRLLFNVLWTVWIYIGATLEESDLVADFGEAYREYRTRVPMFVPSPARLLRIGGPTGKC